MLRHISERTCNAIAQRLQQHLLTGLQREKHPSHTRSAIRCAVPTSRNETRAKRKACARSVQAKCKHSTVLARLRALKTTSATFQKAALLIYPGGNGSPCMSKHGAKHTRERCTDRSSPLLEEQTNSPLVRSQRLPFIHRLLENSDR